MREVSGTDSGDEDSVFQDSLKDHLEVQPAFHRRGRNPRGLRKWLAVAVGVALLVILLLAAVLVGNAAGLWR